MKLLIGSLVVAATVAVVSAQESAKAVETVKVHDEAKARIIAELATVNSRTAFKNSPFSAEESNESIQTLSDGNRIIRSSTGKFYRNSDGRVRREIGGGGGLMGSLYSTGNGVSILNPTLGQHYMLDTELKTARVLELVAGQTLCNSVNKTTKTTGAGGGGGGGRYLFKQK